MKSETSTLYRVQSASWTLRIFVKRAFCAFFLSTTKYPNQNKSLIRHKANAYLLLSLWLIKCSTSIQFENQKCGRSTPTTTGSSTFVNCRIRNDATIILSKFKALLYFTEIFRFLLWYRLNWGPKCHLARSLTFLYLLRLFFWWNQTIQRFFIFFMIFVKKNRKKCHFKSSVEWNWAKNIDVICIQSKSR